MDIIKLDELEIKEDEFEMAAALIRGIIKKFVPFGAAAAITSRFTLPAITHPC